MWCKKYLVFFSSLVRGLQAGIKMPHLTLNIRIAGAGVKILQLALNIRIARAGVKIRQPTLNIRIAGTGVKIRQLTLNVRIARAGVKIRQLTLNIRIARITLLHLCMPGITETYEIIKIIFKKASILFCNAKIIISVSNLMRPSVSVHSH